MKRGPAAACILVAGGIILAGGMILAGGIILAGCSPRIVAIRPFTVHPSQRLDNEDTIVDVQAGVRTTIRYISDAELDEAFRLPGKRAAETGNPFLYRPPRAPVRFWVFRIEQRNESEYDTFTDFGKILLRDDQGNEYRPLDERKLTDYWIGKVTIALGKPLTWTAQMDAIRRRTEKEKSVVETLFTGGRLPSRGEHAGYIAFRDFSPGIKRLQLLIEVVTRSSRYGNPLNVALMEFNSNKTKVAEPPADEPELDQWRNR